MARPKKEDQSELRDHHVGIQLTKREKDELRHRASMVFGLTPNVSEYCRLILLDDWKSPAPNARSPEAIRELAVAISRVGTNVNQLAKIANESRSVPAERMLKEVSEQLAAVLQRVMDL